MDPKCELMYRWFEEVWNKQRETAIDEMFAANGIAHGLTDENGKDLVGPAGFKPFWRKFKTAFPDVKIKVVDTVCEGDKVVVHCVVRGTHRGDTLGIAPKNKPVEFSGTVIVIVKNGKIAEGWNHFDFLGMYQQLGAVTLN
jgi:steroid delta-isomerase-like uncharacterized protein